MQNMSSKIECLFGFHDWKFLGRSSNDWSICTTCNNLIKINGANTFWHIIFKTENHYFVIAHTPYEASYPFIYKVDSENFYSIGLRRNQIEELSIKIKESKW